MINATRGSYTRITTESATTASASRAVATADYGGLNEHCAVVNEPETGLLSPKFHKVLGTAGSVLIAKQES